jgi:putative DNA primase/helicase
MAGQHAVYIQARRYVDGGLSVIPVRLDGSKAPACEWQEFQVRQPMDKELRGWFFEGGSGIAIIGGRVSGNLERIDFDEPGIYEEFATLCSTCGYGELQAMPPRLCPRRQR